MVNRRWGVAGGAAALALMLGGVAATVIAGSHARSRLEAVPRAWQAQWPMLKVVDQHYDRGLWSSTHEFTLQWGCEAGASPLALTLRQRVQHGPLPGGQAVAAGTDTTAAEDMADVLLAKLAHDGMLLREGDMLRAQASFEQGQWLVNGRPPVRPAP